jgi:tight adherence protein C
MVVAGAVAVVAGFFALWWAFSGSREIPVDLGTEQPHGTVDMRTLMLRQGASERAVRPLIERVGARLAGLMPSARIARLQARIQRAGSPPGWTVDRVIAAKVLLALTLGVPSVLVLVKHPSPLAVILVPTAFVLGYFLPDAIIDRRGTERQQQIRSTVADTVDQLTLMVRAGLGIDAAIVRTARTGTGPLAEELARVVQDMRVGVSRGVALSNMAERVDVSELKTVTAALAQAERLGVPVAQTLEVQADELRVKRRQLAEEQAMKLPVKILFPMVLCIFPVLLLVLLGPAAIKIWEELS